MLILNKKTKAQLSACDGEDAGHEREDNDLDEN